MRPQHLHTLCRGQRKDMIAWVGSAEGPIIPALNVTFYHMLPLHTPSSSRERYFAILDGHRDRIVSSSCDADLWCPYDKREFSTFETARRRYVTQLIVCDLRISHSSVGGTRTTTEMPLASACYFGWKELVRCFTQTMRAERISGLQSNSS